MSVGDTELGMAAAQIFNGRNKRLEMIEPPTTIVKVCASGAAPLGRLP